MWEAYCETLSLDDDEKSKWNKRVERINKKLNNHYYNDEDMTNNMLVAGSVGRETAINHTSDYDVIYVLPKEVYDRFSRREGNIQSDLLQEVKKIIKQTYSKTKIRGDGQVVVVDFTDGKLEIVPAFLEKDDTYKYPDSNNGGIWRITNPIPEIEKAKEMKDNTQKVFNYCSFLLRQWKNYQGFPFKGLLIDTMVFRFLKENKDDNIVINRYIMQELFLYLSKQDREVEYWKALGSGQHIKNDDKGEFIKKSEKAYEMFDTLEKDEDLMSELFGYNEKSQRAPHENYIDEQFSINITYRLNIFCTVIQPGFSAKNLMEYSKSPQSDIKTKRTLLFETKHNIPNTLKIEYYWKVRNRGIQSKYRERGNIFKGNFIHSEDASFSGPHYVECYIICDDVVIARDKINVPIA